MYESSKNKTLIMCVEAKTFFELSELYPNAKTILTERADER